MTWKRNVLDKESQRRVSESLQEVLVDLVDLSLQGKQAHWTVKGPNFRSLHKQLDDVVEVARDAADDVAERMAALGVAPDGSAKRVATSSTLEPMPVGFCDWRAMTDWVADRLATCSRRLQRAIHEVQRHDEVSSNLLQDISHLIDKQLWMMQAHEGEIGDDIQREFEQVAEAEEETSTASAG